MNTVTDIFMPGTLVNLVSSSANLLVLFGNWRLNPVLSSVVIMSKSFYLLCFAYQQPPADDGINCVYLLIQEWFLICCKVGR